MTAHGNDEECKQVPDQAWHHWHAVAEVEQCDDPGDREGLQA